MRSDQTHDQPPYSPARPASALRPAPIPRGVADYFWQQARARRMVVTEMLALFRSWGYYEVMPPAFEYAETLDQRASPALQRELYRFVDRDGSTLALRAEMTIPVARLVATRLHDVPMPQRFAYAGTVFRYGETQAGVQREFWQAGIELIGASEPAADAEVLALTAHALERAGLDDVRLAVGHVGYFDALAAELALHAEARDLLIEAIDRNSDAALAGFLQQTALSEEQRAVVAQLPHLSGEDATAILDRARALCLNDAMRAALANLRAILDAFARHRMERRLYIDLTEIHNIGYYTGLTFEALAPSVGFPVASGGRYDHLIGSFGAPQPAVGVALLIDRIILALGQANPELLAGARTEPTIVIGGVAGATPLETADTLRQLGLSVSMDFRPHADAGALWEQARATAPDATLFWDGKEYHRRTGSGRAARMSAPQVAQWAASLTSAQLPVYKVTAHVTAQPDIAADERTPADGAPRRSVRQRARSE